MLCAFFTYSSLPHTPTLHCISQHSSTCTLDNCVGRQEDAHEFLGRLLEHCCRAMLVWTRVCSRATLPAAMRRHPCMPSLVATSATSAYEVLGSVCWEDRGVSEVVRVFLVPLNALTVRPPRPPCPGVN